MSVAREKLAAARRALEAGDVPATQRLLRGLPLTKLGRNETLEAVTLARRVGRPQLALRLLGPIVRPAGGRSDAKAAERTIYGAALVWLGGYREALELFAEVEPDRYPDALLFTSHALVAEWRYAESIPVLERYLAIPSLDFRQRLLGRLNLAAALVHEGWHEPAKPLLETVHADARRGGFTMFAGNALELGAQRAIAARDWDDARRLLDAAKVPLSSGGISEFFLRKWEAVFAASRTGDAAPLATVAREAYRMRHWETARDVDLCYARLSVDRKLATHLFFGTPYEAFRERIFREVPGPLEIPDVYRWSLGEKPNQTVRLANNGFFSPESLSARLLRTLASDFYRPFTTGRLHAALYPNERYDWETSATRVHQAIRELRRDLARRRIPVSVKVLGGGYTLFPTGDGVIVELPRDAYPPSPQSILEQRALRALSHERLEEARALARELDIGLGKTRRLLDTLVRSGSVERIGAGPATRYRLSQKENGREQRSRPSPPLWPAQRKPAV